MRGNSWVSKLSLVDLEPAPVPKALSSPHRLTLQLQKSFSLRRSDSYGRVGSSRDDLDVKVAPASVPRALLFVDTFVKTAEERGFAFALSVRYRLNWRPMRFASTDFPSSSKLRYVRPPFCCSAARLSL